MASLIRIERHGGNQLAIFSDGTRVLCYSGPGGLLYPISNTVGGEEPPVDPPDPVATWAWPFQESERSPGREYEGGGGHNGNDWGYGRALEGASIPCIGPGFVSRVWENRSHPFGGGNCIEIAHGVIAGAEWWSLYAHMLDDAIDLNPGEQVGMGTVLGRIGNTGNSFGAHLHMGILRGNNFTFHDPRAFMAIVNPSDIQQ